MRGTRIFIVCLLFIITVQVWSQVNQVDSLRQEALYSFQKHDFVKAVDLQQQALNIVKQHEKPLGLQYAKANKDLALYVSRNGGSETAVSIIKNAISVYDSIYSPCNEMSLASRLDLVFFQENACQYQEGLNTIGEINEIINCIEDVPEEYSIDLLLKTASLYSLLSDYDNSFSVCKEAMSRSKQYYGEKSEQYAQSLDLMSYIYYQRGDLQRALLFGKQSCDIFKKIPFSTHYIYALNDLASYYCDVGDLKKSIDLGFLVQKMALTEYGAYDAFYINSLNSLACYFANAGDYDDAISYSKDALQICEERGDTTSFSYARSLSHLANFYAENNDYLSAIVYARKTLPAFQLLFGQYSPEYNDELRDLARYCFFAEDYEQSVSFIEDVETNIEEAIIRSFSILSSKERALFLNWYNEWYYYAIPFYCASINSEKMRSVAFNSILFSKGLLLNADIEERKLLKEGDDDNLINAFHQLEKTMRCQESLLIQSDGVTADQDSVGRIIDSLKTVLAEKHGFLDTFLYAQKPSWEDVRQSLSDHEIAIEFFKVDDIDSTCYYALCIKKDYKSPHLITLFTYDDLCKIKPETYYREPMLGELIWENLFVELEGVEKVFFSPTGILQNIGIEYLLLNNNMFFSDLYSVYRLTSTRELLKREIASSFSQAVLYGGLDYNHKNDSVIELEAITTKELSHQLHRGILERGIFGDIPASLNEVIAIEKTLNLSSIKCEVFTGDAGSEKSFRALSGSSISILHLATHGDFIPVVNKKPNRFVDNIDSTEMIAIKNSMEDYAMTRSFIAFSGANDLLDSTARALPEPNNDGIMTAYDISGMDFNQLDLVVLSACKTGLGELSEDGVIGLQRGFKKAGAMSILMSLWKVDDKATELLMVEFYRNYLSGVGKAQSLKNAQKYVRDYTDKDGDRIYEHPYYWAGFVLLDALN